MFEVVANRLDDSIAVVKVMVRRPGIILILNIEMFHQLIFAAAEQALMPGRAPEFTGFQIPVPYRRARRPRHKAKLCRGLFNGLIFVV